MVMFVCNMCGASLKKNKVEEHYRFKCRNCDAVSCMDCGKDFWGDDYMMHNKCISEKEKYQGTPSDYKGDQKQEQWVANVTSAIETYAGNPKVKNLLRMCVDCPNLPRKQKKFVNFVKSSFNERNQTIVCEAWEIIEKASKMNINGNQAQGQQQQQEEEEEKTKQDQSAIVTINNHSPEEETNGAISTNLAEQNDSLDSTTTTTTTSEQLEDNEKDLSSSSPSPTREKRTTKAEEDQVSDEQNGANQEDETDQAVAAESEKAKKKKAKQERKEQLAALQNCEGKKMSKKQLKRLREESISMDLASGSAEESNQLSTINGIDQTSANRKDKKSKKKHREHKESVHEVICEENGAEESERGGDEVKKPDILAQIRLEDKSMKGIPKNANIEPENSQDEEESEKQKERSFNWHKAIKTALKAEDDHSLSMKKLRKKVLAEFMTHGGDGKFKNETEIWALFDKKLHSYPKVKILKDRVTLVK